MKRSFSVHLVVLNFLFHDNSAYVVKLTVGRDNQQTFSLQVDSGSSDLWISSTSCSTSSCGKNGGRLYNPSTSGASATGVGFEIDYLRGHVEGPIFWDRVVVGGYSIENQALSAANIVEDEPLAPNFNGILGIALPLNSIIAERIPPVITNDPDGAAWASNLFSITPVRNAPASRFLSLTLGRPGSNRVPSLMGIGRHPEDIVPDPSLIEYSTLVAERVGTLFWKTTVRSITVYVDGVPNDIDLPRSGNGAVFPTAILDSGVPLIFTSSEIANALYGAIGVSPANDGQYYVPCNQPLNITFRLDNRREIPLHPLDLTADPPDNNRAAFCIGLIQVADAQLGRPNSIADMILGVPFMRNVYTVMAYAQPNSDGSFTPAFDPDEVDEDSGNSTTTPPPTSIITPRLGLLSITDPSIALDEFTTVRVLNKPISNSTDGSTRNPTSAERGGGSKKLSTGIIVLIALLGFFALCCIFFFVRWVLQRRAARRRQKQGFGGGGAGAGGGWGDEGGEVEDTKRALYMGSTMLGMDVGGYQLAERITKERGSVYGSAGGGDTLRSGRSGEGRPSTGDTLRDSLADGSKGGDNHSKMSGDTLRSSRGFNKEDDVTPTERGSVFATQQSLDRAQPGKDGFGDDEEELGDPWDPTTGLPWAVGSAASKKTLAFGQRTRIDSGILPDNGLLSSAGGGGGSQSGGGVPSTGTLPSEPLLTPLSRVRTHQHTRDRSDSPSRGSGYSRPSVYSSNAAYSPERESRAGLHHRQQSSTVVPLLSGMESDHGRDGEHEEERRGRRAEVGLSYYLGSSSNDVDESGLGSGSGGYVDEFGSSALGGGGGMAGVGTASRTKKLSVDDTTRFSVSSGRGGRYRPSRSRERERERSNGSRKSLLGSVDPIVAPPLPVPMGGGGERVGF
ncbi:endopeptidase [Coprinopsis cinerea okayama7|uniref:Endopeptidase n=1 Tax=Coprinopsis cinerea (strain Okayama-7 / 130 / ATCC MYA-4618 / FGSC 9003) TaxID=240176 RepID=A8PF96_COPC7|nr:endopeptidase [Coprinopsis cinerea okayama7\|eukprot:XP_001840961.2 endopeptidase [Coprinopsis cinerea okayama7\